MAPGLWRRPGRRHRRSDGEARTSSSRSCRSRRQQSVYYQAKIKFADGSELTLPDNYADPYYQLYQGETVPLYCTDFDSTDPFADGWTTGTQRQPVAVPVGAASAGGATDPHAAFSGANLVGMALGGNYNPSERAWLKSPPIDIGRYSDVRLHYRRWLAVEDSHFDQARSPPTTRRPGSTSPPMRATQCPHHVDREWRFHDVALSGYFWATRSPSAGS